MTEVDSIQVPIIHILRPYIMHIKRFMIECSRAHVYKIVKESNKKKIVDFCIHAKQNIELSQATMLKKASIELNKC